MVIGFPPGGGTDIVGRIVAQKLTGVIRGERAKYARIVKDANVRLD